VSCTVSVVMPVHNAGAHLGEAARSILDQSFEDLELLIIDDGSTDDTARIAGSLKDGRVRFLRNGANLGVAATLNRGLDEARGEFIARMDGDDISRPERLERQVAFMLSRPGLGICGSWVRYFGERKPFVYRYPVGEECVDATLLFANPLAHGSVMFRTSLMRQAGLRYDEEVKAAQDFDLWRRSRGRIAMDNIPAVLLDYRRHGGSVSAKRRHHSRARLLHLLAAALGELGVEAGGESLLFHAEVGNGSGMGSRDEVLKARHWLAGLAEANGRKKIYHHAGLAAASQRVWFNVCRNSAHLGPWVWRTWRAGRSGLPSPAPPGERFFFAAAAIAALGGRKGGYPQGRLELGPGDLEP